uniref:Phospholipid-transporting ATPase n=1 Tax=Rhabditophanes sp. KR3021 TaxID=114890 RepID=A0AC35U5V3_9BILA
MKFDLDMYHEESDTAMASNALNIPEELGLIKGCHIAGEDFSDDCEPFTTHIYEDPEVYTSKSLKERLTKEVLDESSQIYHFFMNLAICNTVVVNKKREDTIDRGFKEGDTLRVCNSSFYSPQNEDEIATDDGNESDRTNLEQLNSSSTEDNDNESVSSLSDRIRTSVRSFSNKVSSNLKSSQKRIITAFNRKSDQSKLLDRKVSNKDNFYEGESPDELSLVKAAKAYGFEMKKRFPSHINITINRLGPMSMNVTKVLRFDSIRKRMSVVSMQNGKIYLYSKGSDDSIFNSLCSSFSNTEEGTIKIKLAKQAVQNFAEDGKRTLVFGYKILSFEELEAFNDILDKIETSDPDDKDDQLTSVFDSMEKKLILLGVVSIEDRLQDGVSETIIALRRAGVKVWVLTGDKYETALNIAKGCSLFLHDSTILKIDKEEDMDRVPIRVSSYNVVLSSDGIKLLRANDEKLINLLKHASSVLCYRMTPGEKADISNMVKKHFKAHVLAIGDGANDVPMIQSADIGVGIGGQEGRQAVMSADFSFARFKFLQKLLLVHGHWNYYRITEALLLLFYKNFMYCLILFWYNFYNGFSAMCPYDQNYGMLYPIIFSGLQPIIYGIFDQDYSAKELLNNPEKYKITQQNSNYSIRLFLLNVVDAIWQSLAIYFIAYFAYKDTDVDMWTFGYCLITSIFFVNSFHMALLIKSWNVIQTVVNVFFFFVHFLFFFVYTMTANAKAGIPDTPVYTAPNTTFTFIFWAVIFLTTSVSLMPRFYIKILTKRYPILLLQEDDKLRIKTFFKKKFT